jgi:Lamin Tail Domain
MKHTSLLARCCTALLACTGLAAASADAQVRISQVYGGGGLNAYTPNADYVELYNAGGAAVDMTGWAVQLASTTGTTWQVLALPSGATIPAGGYYLIRTENAVSTGYALSPDASFTTGTNLSSAGGKVALTNNVTALAALTCGSLSAAIQDLVGVGSTGTSGNEGPCPFSTTFATTAPTSSTAVFRQCGGTRDTNVNSSDFRTGVPAPRNSSFTAATTRHVFTATSSSSAVLNLTPGATVTLSATPSNSTATAPGCAAGSVVSVSVDTSPIGGGIVNLSGTGFAAWTSSFTVPGAAPGGVSILPVTWTDDLGNTGRGNIVVAVPPALSTCANATTPAQTVPGIGGTINLTSAQTAGWVASGSACAGSGAVAYFSFTPSTAGPWRFSLCGTLPSFDSVLSIHTACPATSSNYATGSATTSCGDDNCGSLSQFDTGPLTIGQTYIIRVARFSGTTAAAVRLDVQNLSTFGACCNGTTCTFTDSAGCTFTFQGSGTSCTPNICAGACCVGGTCTLTTLAGCAGTFNGLGTSCTPNPCVGACCNGVACTTTSAAACVSPSVFKGLSSVCSPLPCPGPTSPPNDECAAATAFTGSGFTVNGDLVAASTDPMPAVPSACWSSSYRDVWYSFTPDATGQFSATMCNTTTGSQDTVLSVHSACPTLTMTNLIMGLCNDDGCSGGPGPSAITTMTLTGGTTYLFRVARFGTSGTGAPFQLVVGAVVGSCCTTSGTCSITTQAACPSPSVWTSGQVCSVTACNALQGACCNPNTGSCSITFPGTCAVGSNFLGSGTVCSPTNPCPQPSGACCTFAGVCTVGPATACVSPDVFQGNATTCSPNNCPLPVGNNDCANAFVASVGNNLGDASASNNDGRSSCDLGAGRDVWWTFTPTITSNYRIDTCSSTSAWDSVVSVHTGCAPDASLEIAGGCADQGCGTGSFSDISSLMLTAGTTYTIRVAGWSTSVVPSTYVLRITQLVSGACCDNATGVCSVVASTACLTGGTYQGDNTSCTPNPCPQPTTCCIPTGVCVVIAPGQASTCAGFGGVSNVATSCTPSPCGAPANLTCATASPLTLNVWALGNNNLSTGGTDVPAPTCASSSAKAVWYSFTAPATAAYTISTCGSPQDTVVQVFSSPDCTALTALACDDDACVGTEPSQIPLVVSGSGAASLISSLVINAGDTIYVRMSSFGTTPTGGNFQLRVSAVNAIGSCCASAGTCTLTDAANCTGGPVFTAGGVCSPNTCPQPSGSCCVGARCVTGVADAAACNGLADPMQSGVFTAGGTTCNWPFMIGGDTVSPCCLADYNKAGGLTVNDIFDFLTGWFNGSANADINGSGLSVNDIFDFLGAWFAGGC